MKSTEFPKVLGIDTSAYTTSLALVSPTTVLQDVRRVLPVPEGHRGLRPSEALYLHVEELPRLLKDVLKAGEALAAVAVSTRPRPLAGSYLPPFRAGQLAASAIAHALSVPLFETTHQEGHLAAGIRDAGGPRDESFWAVHVSGGTTELLAVERHSGGFRVKLVGHSADLYAGQLIDRVGVRLGLAFPSGPYLEELARTARDRVTVPVGQAVLRDDLWCVSFSGPESALMRAAETGSEPAAVAHGAEDVVARGLIKLIEAGANPPGPLLVVGGVAANTHLRTLFNRRLADRYRLYFASPALSRDNAVGVAQIGLWQVSSGQRAVP